MLKKGIVFMLMMVLVLAMVAPAGAITSEMADEKLVRVDLQLWRFHASKVDGLSYCDSDGNCANGGLYIVELAEPQIHKQAAFYFPEGVAKALTSKADCIDYGFFSRTQFIFYNSFVNNYDIMVFSDDAAYEQLEADLMRLERCYGQWRVKKLTEQYREQGHTVIDPVPVEGKNMVDVVKCQTADREIYAPKYVARDKWGMSHAWIKVSSPDVSWANKFSNAVVENGEIFLELDNNILVDGERTANRDLKIEYGKDITIFNQF
jgi:hypothetical protein